MHEMPLYVGFSGVSGFHLVEAVARLDGQRAREPQSARRQLGSDLTGGVCSPGRTSGGGAAWDG